MKKGIGMATVTIALTLIGYYMATSADVPERTTEIIKMKGAVNVKEKDVDRWREAEIGMEFKREGIFQTLRDSYADMSVEKLRTKNVVVRVKEDSMVKTEVNPSEIVMRVESGRALFWVRKEKELEKFEARTPNAIVGVEGSLGVLQYDIPTETTVCWLKSKGAYVVNIYTAEYKHLEPGAYYIVIKDEDVRVMSDYTSVEVSYDLRGFSATYAFVKREAVGHLGKDSDIAARYRKTYSAGRYRTTVNVFEGEVVVAPYDEWGALYDQGYILTGGAGAVEEGEIEEDGGGGGGGDDDDDEDDEMQLEDDMDDEQEDLHE